MTVIGKWADCMGHPSGAALKAAGFTGIFLYVGTPGRAKNATGSIYRDYLLAGLQIACVYENTADDISSGAGAAHARAAVADMRAMGMPDTMPLAAAADEHLAAGQIPTAVSYQAQFHAAARDAGWTGPIGGYGFSEFTHAVSIAGVAEWLWQCGSSSLSWPGVTFWQRNTGTATVAGIQVDINDQYLPIPGGFLMTLNDAEQAELLAAARTIRDQITGGVNADGSLHGWPGLPGKPDGTLIDMVRFAARQFADRYPSRVKGSEVTMTLLDAILDANAFAFNGLNNTIGLQTDVAALSVGGVDVEALATALTAALGPEVAKAIGQKLVS